MLMVALAFVILVSISGTILLSLSYTHQVQMQSKALAVRMMAAAESAIEAKRGRFTLVAGVQDDWLALLPAAGWNNIDGPLVINGLTVQVQAQPTGSFSVPMVRIRGLVTAGLRTLAVEYQAKVPQFSDYSVFAGSNSTYNPGVNYKSMGNHYSRGNIFIDSTYTGVEFFGKTELSGTVTSFGVEGAAYNFKQSPIPNVAPRQINFTGVDFSVPRARAATLNFLFTENTIAINFNGNGTFTRTYVERLATGSPATVAMNNNYPLSNAWVNTASGAIINANLTTADYSVQTSVHTIQPESVIFVEEGIANLNDISGGAVSARVNNYVQPLHQATAYTQGWTAGGARTPRKLLLIGGTLGTNDRVTVVSGGNIMTVIRECTRYSYLLANPTFRNANNKQLPGALNPPFTEMLGVISNTDINMAWQWWTPLTIAQECPVTAGGGTSSQAAAQPGQYCIDGNFAAVNSSLPGTWLDGTGREIWFCGGNGGNALINSGLGNIFSPPAGFTHGARHYDWDWRLFNTAPPYYLRVYNVSARFVPGTWRSYEL